ncbi:helix-turn-helix domain-containing protein [Pseudooceanicola sp. CBS1P-1]|uniref:Helix-turn-helix domain-containing protein n=1 Tax=Pseudooceanicola albus TaxID=2692189 RepID=A0A6L7G9R4_9RHOB|nr:MULTISPECIES: helix-turn-helix domain-containing protein [Pseudooceanicola]MBT9386109.1 helix-turn-helix domain-containing protein [Pseudooceanicola endophyticus]MXN19473.1 helix-turn-helix domain-containing protein [Pseudooceanicola albus]
MAAFSTRHLSTRERRDYWHDLVSRTFSASECNLHDQEGFDGDLDVFGFGDIDLSRLSSGAVSYDRTARHIRSDSFDHFLIHVLDSGEGWLTQNDRRIRHVPGSVVIYDSSRPFSFRFEGGYSSVVLRVPRPLLQSRLVDADRLGGSLGLPERPETRLVAAMLREFAGIAAEGRLSRETLCSSLDLMMRALLDPAAEAMPDPGAALHRIKRFLTDNLTDETLTVADICRRQNISVRSLNRAFARDGTTPTAWLRDQRLALAHAMLSEGRVQTVSEAAFAAGFADLTHFGRSFKRRYARTPSQVLARH